MTSHSNFLHKSVFNHFFEIFINVIKEMPLPQGVIVMLVLGISVGSFWLGGIDQILHITNSLVYITVFGLGLISLSLFSYVEKDQTLLVFSTVFVIIATIFQLFNYSASVYLIIYNLTVIFFMIFVFLISIQNFFECHIKSRDCNK